jgi:hypothetical protein
MNEEYHDIMKQIRDSGKDDATVFRGVVLSQNEALKELLVSKEIITEGEYNKYFNRIMKRNFQLK